MNAEQKRAWLAVATSAACIVGYLVLLPFVGLNGASAAFAFFGLNGLTPFIWRGGKIDERDRAIALRATMIGGMVSYLAFVAGCMGTWIVVYMVQRQELISAHVLATITMLGAIVFLFTRGLAVLVLYGRHVEAGNA